MTKFSYFVYEGNTAAHLIVTRLADGKQKYFYSARKGPGIAQFMDTMTDELIDGYYPKPNKQGKSDVDNWAFLGDNPDRLIAESLASERYQNLGR